MFASEQDRPSIAIRRAQWWSKYQGRLDPRRLVFIDETWAKTNMAPLRGWGPRKHRLVSKTPHGTLTFLAALRCERIDAMMSPSESVGTRNCSTQAMKLVVLMGPSMTQGVMDSRGSHKGPAIRRAIQPAGAKLFYLPPYSPDLNPIEQVFAKLKHLMRKAAERTVEATWRRIGALLESFPPARCANYLVNAGYASN